MRDEKKMSRFHLNMKWVNAQMAYNRSFYSTHLK